ncbi:hypothetical protein F0562_001431 [Nyssa sinensis]|uniref:Leucine-rich repeat-containing N-terminal plant-type domain-containing protein n=1 Tax=Nyssa sinensis TaxID=561372 RepID=A0A5J5C7D1_9ASTE|nr:hypothetical protein F0562_001431 [Nyssa sinensis]
MGHFIFFFFISAILLAISSSVNSCPPSDRAALLAFKAALHEPYLGIFNSWTGTDCCHNWYGVTCDPIIRRVADINLRGESEDPIFEKAGRTGFMTGSISPAICKLNRLSSLIIADWKGISGTIPPCIASLPFLRILDLIGNKISGEIPADIGKLSRLTVLNVADNAISGTIPRSITNLNSLMHLDLRNNQISGTIPRNFGRLRMMSRALLSRNRLTGPIPRSVTNIYRLSDLDLSFNQISGPIPATFGKMAVLATLNLDGNQISGMIPPTLFSSGISILNLSRNALEGSPFDHLEASSFAFNDCLCGKPLRTC